MNIDFFKPRIILSLILLIFGLIIAAVPENTTKPYKLTAPELLDEVKTGTQFVHPDLIADMIVKKDPTLLLIDVRSPDEFSKYSLPGAINIPLDDVLNDDWKDYLDQDVRMNVFYSNGTTKANEAWLITRQLGYKNNFVLTGGLNYWTETILNPEEPGMTSPDDEFARYNFRKAASGALGGTAVEPVEQGDQEPSLPKIIPKKKKKSIKGGCS